MIDDDPAQTTAPNGKATEGASMLKAVAVGAAVALAFAVFVATTGVPRPVWAIVFWTVIVQALVTAAAHNMFSASDDPLRLLRRKSDTSSSEDGWSTYDIRLALEGLDLPLLLLHRSSTGQVFVVARSRGARETIPACAAVVRSDWEILAAALPEEVDQLAQRTWEDPPSPPTQTRRITLSDMHGRSRLFDVQAKRLDRDLLMLTFQDVSELALTLKAKEHFVAHASHELRTPLAAILGAVETLREALRDSPEAAERFVRMIETNALRLSNIANRLLALARLESEEQPLRCEPFDPDVMTESLRSLFETLARSRDLELRIEFDEALRGFHVDPWRLWTILQNLVDNAIKYSDKPGSTVQVRGRLDEQDRAVFEVQDQGAGIPWAEQERIFEHFYQVDPTRKGADPKGAGLGLALVKRAVEQCKGSIELDSMYDRGTTFRVALPRATDLLDV